MTPTKGSVWLAIIFCEDGMAAVDTDAVGHMLAPTENDGMVYVGST
jgi:hypothetical protein